MSTPQPVRNPGTETWTCDDTPLSPPSYALPETGVVSAVRHDAFFLAADAGARRVVAVDHPVVSAAPVAHQGYLG